MKTLGIDYGKSKFGLSIGVVTFAEPLKVIKYQDIQKLQAEIKEIIEEEKIDKVVVGVSEREMAKESKDFSINLSKNINIPVETFDETLTSNDAQKMSMAAGVPQKRRHAMEDAYAATIMLQNYLDSIKP